MNNKEALKASKQLKDFVLGFIKNGLHRRFIIGSFEIIETALKALEIIKKKNVDIEHIKACFYEEKGGLEKYNSWVRHDEDKELIQEEFDLLKDWLKNE